MTRAMSKKISMLKIVIAGMIFYRHQWEIAWDFAVPPFMTLFDDWAS